MSQAECFVAELRSLLEANDKQLRSLISRRGERMDRYDELNACLYEFRTNLTAIILTLVEQLSTDGPSRAEAVAAALREAKESFEHVRMLFQMKTVLNNKIKATIESLETGEKRAVETHVTKLADSLRRIDESISKKLCEEIPSTGRREDRTWNNGLPAFDLSTAAFKLNAGELFGNVITPMTERARRDKSILCSSLHSKDLSPIAREADYPTRLPTEVPPRPVSTNGDTTTRGKNGGRSLFEMFDECLDSIERTRDVPTQKPSKQRPSSTENGRRVLRGALALHRRKVNDALRFHLKLWRHSLDHDKRGGEVSDDIDLLEGALTFNMGEENPRRGSGPQEERRFEESSAEEKKTKKKRAASQCNKRGPPASKATHVEPRKGKDMKTKTLEKKPEVPRERDRSKNKENEGMRVRNLVPPQPLKKSEEEHAVPKEKDGHSIVGKKINHIVSFK